MTYTNKLIYFNIEFIYMVIKSKIFIKCSENEYFCNLHCKIQKNNSLFSNFQLKIDFGSIVCLSIIDSIHLLGKTIPGKILKVLGKEFSAHCFARFWKPPASDSLEFQCS